ncbi:MAG: ribonuclease Z [Oscillospiraceae bacterium]|nr:ribonuclease Z [Oscillospiraceae bacterium]
MTLIVCLDDKNGMAFNHRRQSQDRLLRRRVLDLAGEAPLWMNAYSAGQFGESAAIRVAEDFLDRAGPGDFAFAEFPPLAPWAERAERIIALRWNRLYPADARLDIDLSAWRLTSTEEFPGSSHETLTLEVYQR